MTEPATTAPGRPKWLDLFQAFRIATDPGKIWTGFLGLICSFALVVVCGAVLVNVGGSSSDGAGRAIWEHLRQGSVEDAGTETLVQLELAAEGAVVDLKNIEQHLFDDGLMAAVNDATVLQELLLLVMGALLVAWLPWALFGGILSRSAAVEYATGRRVPRKEARAFVLGRYPSYFWPPVTLLLLALAFLAGIVLVALASAHVASAAVLAVGLYVSLYVHLLVKQRSRSGLWATLAALVPLAATVFGAVAVWGISGVAGRIVLVLSSPLLFLGGLAVALLLVVAGFGRGMMAATISYEGTDAFDALSRSFDYVLRHPWRLLSYTVMSVVYGAVCLSVVVFFALAAVLIAVLAAWVGYGESFAFLYGAPTVCPVIDTLIVLLGCLVIGWCLSFVQAVRAIAYALLRKSVDLCETSEILLEAGAAVAKPPGAGTPSQGQP